MICHIGCFYFRLISLGDDETEVGQAEENSSLQNLYTGESTETESKGMYDTVVELEGC